MTLTPKTPQRVNKLWGHEQIIVNNGMYCGKILTVEPNGYSCSIHFHKSKTETFHILEGELYLQIGRYDPQTMEYHLTPMKMEAGTHLTVHPFIAHRFWAKQCTKFIEFSTPDAPEDSYRIIKSGIAPEKLEVISGKWHHQEEEAIPPYEP